MPIKDLKEELEEVAGIASDRQKLLYRGQALTDDKKLSDYVSEDG